MRNMEEDLNNANKLIAKDKIEHVDVTLSKINASYEPNKDNRLQNTIKLSEKLDQVLANKGFNTYDFIKKESQLNFIMLNATIVDLFHFYNVPPADVKYLADWENYVYQLLGAEYLENNSLYKLAQKEFIKEIKVLLNLNRADFLSEKDKGEEVNDQKDFNKLVTETEKAIKKNFKLGLIKLLELCEQNIIFHQKKYDFKKTFDFYERYIVLKGFKIFKTFRKYNDKFERNREVPIWELLTAQEFLNTYKAKTYFERQFFTCY